MSRQKRTSTVSDTARQRLAGLKSINPAPDFGANLTAAGYEADINAFSNKLDSYNERLAGLDPFQNEIDELEVFLREKSARILAATEGHYGPDSDEYEQVGGTRKSDRKRPGPRKAKPRAAQSASPADGAVHADRTEEVKDAGR